MSKVLVKLVKYDTQKTKKRKRSDLLVDQRSVESVIEKLEKIHKGDSVKEVFEVIWDEEAVEDVGSKKSLMTGRVKFFDPEKGFGFIEPDEQRDDLFFHASALGDKEVYDDDIVEFEISKSPKGQVAIHIRIIENND